MTRLDRLIAWLLMLPSWVVEAIGALGLVVLVAAWPSLLVRLLLASAASLVYERVLDRNGWSLEDVAQRQVFIVLVEVFRRLL